MTTGERATECDIFKIADLEQGLSITAGYLDTEAFYRLVEVQRSLLQAQASPLGFVFGRFLNLARRERCLTLAQLAESIDVDLIELWQVEEGNRVPEPRVVSKLARVLEVPPGRLMQLAGHVSSLDKNVTNAAYAFAARSNAKPLEPDEVEALHEFVKALASD